MFFLFNVRILFLFCFPSAFLYGFAPFFGVSCKPVSCPSLPVASGLTTKTLVCRLVVTMAYTHCGC
jgi:hypothetical protein